MILEGLHLDPSLYIPDLAARGIHITQSLSRREPAFISGRVVFSPEKEVRSSTCAMGEEIYQVNSKECHDAHKNLIPEKQCRFKGLNALNDLKVIHREFEPIFIPVVVTMDQGDHQLLCHQWSSNVHRSCGLDFQNIFQQVKLLDRYLQEAVCKGVAAISVDISSPSSALDRLHDHFLDCVEVAMKMR